MPYYAVANGRKQGIFNTWDECKEQVYQFAGARYKKFDTVQAAQQFIDEKSTRKSYVRVETKSTTEKRKFSAQGSDSNNAVNSKSIRIEVSKPLNSSTIIVYTDGACSSNGRSHAKAGVGVYFGDGHADNVSEPLPSGPQTNNRAEYQAVSRALEIAKERNYSRLEIRTDSNLLVRSMNEWMPKWKKNGWKTATNSDVKNRDLLEKIDNFRSHVDAKFVHVDGHSGIHGNEMADSLARQGVSKHV